MHYPKTILTYSNSSEAEVDKSMLESHGITVYLMNANVSRAEIGSPFHIQLQVPGEQVPEAIAILRELKPERFGSPEVVKEIEAGIFRGFIRFSLFVLVCTIILFVFFIHESSISQRLVISIINGAMLGGLIFVFYAFLKPKKKNGG